MIVVLVANTHSAPKLHLAVGNSREKSKHLLSSLLVVDKTPDGCIHETHDHIVQCHV